MSGDGAASVSIERFHKVQPSKLVRQPRHQHISTALLVLDDAIDANCASPFIDWTGAYISIRQVLQIDEDRTRLMLCVP